MAAIVLDGKKLAEDLRENIKVRCAKLTPALGRPPGLAVVLVGENPASQVYVRAKSIAAEKCGIRVIDVPLEASISDATLQAQLRELSLRGEVDGILLQLPLPAGLDEFGALMSIDPAVDVDGLHPTNQGLLLRGAQTFEPCTPRGVMALIDLALSQLGRGLDLSGKRACVVGRSILVGKPVSLMLQERNATVTMCHSRTRDLAEEIVRADIVVAAVGKPEFLRGEWLKPSAVVLDVGTNRLPTGKLVGDVHFESASAVASAISPSPGGVGPLTITMLLDNTVRSAEMRLESKQAS